MIHKPTSLLVHGPNYYASFDDSGSADHCRCESNNSPTRSSNAVYESIFDDDGDPRIDKTLLEAGILSRPLAASTSVKLSVAVNYGSYTDYTRPDATNFTGTNAVAGFYKLGVKGKVQYKISLTSSGTSSPKISGLYVKLQRSILY